jgi:hypothetical protein
VDDETRDIHMLVNRRNTHREWLKANAPETFTEQKHGEEGSAERAYWMHGYMMALTDVLVFLGSEHRETTSRS